MLSGPRHWGCYLLASLAANKEGYSELSPHQLGSRPTGFIPRWTIFELLLLLKHCAKTSITQEDDQITLPSLCQDFPHLPRAIIVGIIIINVLSAGNVTSPPVKAGLAFQQHPILVGKIFYHGTGHGCCLTRSTSQRASHPGYRVLNRMLVTSRVGVGLSQNTVRSSLPSLYPVRGVGK